MCKECKEDGSGAALVLFIALVLLIGGIRFKDWYNEAYCSGRTIYYTHHLTTLLTKQVDHHTFEYGERDVCVYGED